MAEAPVRAIDGMVSIMNGDFDIYPIILVAIRLPLLASSAPQSNS